MAGKLVHFEIPAQDSDRAKTFYGNALGWSFGDSAMPGMEYFMTEAGGQPGGAVYSMEGASPHLLLYFDTDDIDASVVKVREAGGEAPDKQPIPHVGWFARCADTEGNDFSLFQSNESVTP
jgi:predicted enzyme related to lactoylglutathione lyase